ncbi:hypothetical protein D9611_006691 [Ephemerocybe angulata]|uniref:Uncharacterized protein n=1 Tax=Ephemerocybe angulata TaxID=980116 RepID=A0A8H5C766_9AGAR|nr:hypothetical protein D9611_006691 [Tulosesus angulatus]
MSTVDMVEVGVTGPAVIAAQIPHQAPLIAGMHNQDRGKVPPGYLVRGILAIHPDQGQPCESNAGSPSPSHSPSLTSGTPNFNLANCSDCHHLPQLTMPRRHRREDLVIFPEVDEIPVTVAKSSQYPPPVIGEIHPITGKKSRPKVFAIPVHVEQQMRFIEHYYPAFRSLSGSEKIWEFMRKVAQFFPSDWYPELAWVIVPMQKKVWETLAIVICGNRNEDEMTKAYDEERIKQIQGTIGVKTPPGWYYVIEDPDA